MRSRRFAIWSLSLPLMIAGTQVAHALSFWLVYPDAQVRMQELLLTGHGYMSSGLVGRFGYLPLVLGMAAALELVAFGSSVLGSVYGRSQAQVPPWAFALLPLLGFTLQEFLERWLAGAPFPWQVVLTPTFQIGLLVELPFVLLTFLLARLLSSAAERVGRVLARNDTPFPVLVVEHGLAWFVRTSCRPRVTALAGGHAERGPPL